MNDSGPLRLQLSPRGRLARLPSGRVAEVVDHDRGRLRAVVLRTGRRVTVHADRVAWVGGDGP